MGGRAHSVKAEPSRPVASLATRATAKWRSMRRYASEWAVVNKAPKSLYSQKAEMVINIEGRKLGHQ